MSHLNRPFSSPLASFSSGGELLSSPPSPSPPVQSNPCSFCPAPSLTPPPSSSSPPQLTYLPPPWGECEAKALGFFHVYSVTACRIDCETRYIVENCNCRMVHMPGREAAAAGAAGGAPFPVFTLLFLLQATRRTALRSSTRTAPSRRWVGPHVHRSTRDRVAHH